jgi:hypothetical protein
MNKIDEDICLKLLNVRLSCRFVKKGIVFGLTDKIHYVELLNISTSCVPFEGNSEISFSKFHQAIFDRDTLICMEAWISSIIAKNTNIIKIT